MPPGLLDFAQIIHCPFMQTLNIISSRHKKSNTTGAVSFDQVPSGQHWQEKLSVIQKSLEPARSQIGVVSSPYRIKYNIFICCTIQTALLGHIAI